MRVEGARAQLPSTGGVWRYSSYDAVLVALSFVHGAILVALSSAHSAAFLAVPSIAIVAVGLWWSANTVSHNFIHLPFFRSATLNRAYSYYLSVLLGLPQSLWRDRHLAHHEGRLRGVRLGRDARFESMAVIALWAGLLVAVPAFFWATYLPGYVIGLGLCLLHGHFEHVPVTSSYYGSIYNAWFFNDGYHVEHHARPQRHWTRLPVERSGGVESRWPAVLRGIDMLSLEGLERAVLRSRLLQALVLGSHEAAIRRLLAEIGEVKKVSIVGGGLFPRSAIICRRLFPDARIQVIDASLSNIATARRFLDDLGIDFVHAMFEPGSADPSADLMVIPLALIGDRRRVYTHPPARITLVHDWVWNGSRSATSIVSLFLLKRINLVARP